MLTTLPPTLRCAQRADVLQQLGLLGLAAVYPQLRVISVILRNQGTVYPHLLQESDVSSVACVLVAASSGSDKPVLKAVVLPHHIDSHTGDVVYKKVSWGCHVLAF